MSPSLIGLILDIESPFSSSLIGLNSELALELSLITPSFISTLLSPLIFGLLSPIPSFLSMSSITLVDNLPLYVPLKVHR